MPIITALNGFYKQTYYKYTSSGVYLANPDYIISIIGGLIRGVKTDGSQVFGPVANGGTNLYDMLTSIWADGAKWVHFKIGTYETTVVIDNTPAYCRITGDSQDSTVIKGVAAVADGVIKIDQSGIELEDFTIDADNVFNYGVRVNDGFSSHLTRVVALDAIDGFRFDAAAPRNGHRLEWCKSKEHTGNGVNIFADNTDIWIVGGVFSVSALNHDFSAGIRINSTGIQCIGNHIWGNDYGYALADTTSVEQLQIIGDYIENNVRHNIMQGEHSLRNSRINAAFWTPAAAVAARAARIPALAFPNCGCDIYANPTGAWRVEDNVIDSQFNGRASQNYAIYSATQYFRYNNLMASQFKAGGYLTAYTGQGVADAAAWNLFRDPRLTPDVETQAGGAWASPVMPPLVGRYEGKRVTAYNSTLAAYRLYTYVNGTWRYAALT